MNIIVVSRSWPSNERSGVALVAAAHVRLLVAAGHQVAIVGAHNEVLAEQLPVVARFHVPAFGSGALYAPAHVDTDVLAKIMCQYSPDIVLVEAWQTSLTDAAVDVAAQMNLPVVVLSHGVSIHPFSLHLRDVSRAIGWWWYRWYTFPRRIKRLSVLATLDVVSHSPRFFDRLLAERLKVPVLPYTNAPVNWKRGNATPEERKSQILIVGYFSPVKNQIAAIQLLSRISPDLKMCFIGQRQGRYYEKCVDFAHKLKVIDRILFLQDDECEIGEEIANSLMVLSPSKTEVLPLTLLEAMASGTPFVATSVGAVPSLSGGLLADSEKSLVDAITALAFQPELWKACARDGIARYESRHTREHVGLALEQILRRSIG